MSGHSKWSTIKRQKGAKDAARGAIFTKLGNAIAVAARNGSDPETNFSLRLAIDKAKAANMPSANIQRSIDRVKDKNAAELVEVVYEGYGPGGAAILVECATDNINRTLPDVKSAFSKHGGRLAEKGSVVFQFAKKGKLHIQANANDDDVILAILEAGAEDVQEVDGEIEVLTEPKMLASVRDNIASKGFKVDDYELTYVPQNIITVDDSQTAAKLIRLMEALENLDDVSNVHFNFDIKESIIT